MTFEGDPYRELGVAPGASLNEIKSAYRRLVKRYHPDAAGERALPRFLAIQAAYERLVDGEGRLRGGAWRAGQAPGPGSGGGAGSGAGAWRADPGRARASRDAWRARRSGSGGTAGYRPSGGAGAGAGTGAGAGGPARGSGSGGGPRSGSTSSTSGSTSSRPPGSGERHHHRRTPRTATPGSTTYDEAAETPLDPEWDGGAWYGPSSGTYWTINPREYADPRKHGPEYLARARRDAPGAPGAPAPDGAPGASTPDDDLATEPGWAWTGTHDADSTTGGAGAWRTRAWTFEAADDPGTAREPGRAAREAARGTAREPRRGTAREPGRGTASEPGDRRPFGPGPSRATGVRPQPAPDAGTFPDLESVVRRAFPESLLALAQGPDRRWRLLLALVAWPAIGYSLGGLVGTATGCARYAATCPEAVPVLLLLAQPLIVAGLYLVPPAAAVAAFAALAALAIALPAGAVLSVGALPEPVIEPTVLGVIVAVTYVIAFIAAVVRLWGPLRDGDKGTGRGP
jgi:hypothetical protein